MDRKWLSFLCVFQLGGCGLLGVGLWLSVSQGSFATLSPSFPSLSAANLIITLGSVVMVTGFLGCLGAIKENKCLLLSVRTTVPIMHHIFLFFRLGCNLKYWSTYW